MAYSYTAGTVIGAMSGAATKTILTVLGAAGIWGFSEATKFRDSSDPENNERWRTTTITAALFTATYFINEEYRSIQDQALMKALHKEKTHAAQQSGVTNNICSFFKAASSAMSKPTAAMYNLTRTYQNQENYSNLT